MSVGRNGADAGMVKTQGIAMQKLYQPTIWKSPINGLTFEGIAERESLAAGFLTEGARVAEESHGGDGTTITNRVISAFMALPLTMSWALSVYRPFANLSVRSRWQLASEPI